MMNSTTRHDELLADFRSKAEHAKSLRQQSVIQHRANLSSQITRMSEEAARKEKRQSVHAAHLEQVRSHVEAEVVTGIDTVEANLRRLGLDNASAHRAPRASSKAQHVKEYVRPSIIQGSSMGGGVVAFLRRTGEKSGVDGTSLFMSKEHSPVRGKQKLTGPKVLYPTMRAHLDESDEETPSDVRDVSYEALNDEYVNKIRGRKDDDVQALREREVRRHRMNGEQSRSKNQVLEQKELEKLLLRAKLINAPDRQRVIDKRIEGIQKDLEKKLRAEMIGRRREAASATVEAQLQQHLHETVEQRSAELAEFAVLRNQGKQREDHIKHEKLRDKEAFCRLLVNGVVGMVGEVIERSTSTLQDGTEQYNRATLGITEWRDMVSRHLCHKDAPLATVTEPEYTTPAMHSVVEAPLPEVQVRDVDVSQMVQADVDYFINHAHTPSQVTEEPTPFKAVFIGGDPIISGVDLLTQNGDVTFTAGEKREYLLLTPQLVQHLEYQSAKRTLDESLRDVEEALVQVTTDLQAKQAMLAAQTPIVKGKRDAKTKDTSPLAQSVMQLSSVHSELTQRQSSIRLDASNLHSHAIVHVASDEELGALVGSLISCRQSGDGHAVHAEDGNQVPLTMAHVKFNPDLADAVLLFAGFPLTPEFGSAVQEHVDDLSSIAYCELGCDAVSAVHRLDGVQEFLKYPRPPAVPVEMEASQGKKKGVKIAPPTPALAVPTEDPKPVLAHPLLSPLVVYRGERDQIAVPATVPPTAPTHPAGRASPSMLRSNSVSIIVPTPCPDVNDLEYATSPFMLPQDGDRSTARAKFTKFVKWHSGREPNQFQWLLDYSHTQLPAEAASRMEEASVAMGGIHCFKALVGDSVLGEGLMVTNTTPGTAAYVPDVDDTVYFSQFVIATNKLCGSIIRSQSEATNAAVTADAEPIDTSIIKDAATSYRTSLAEGLQAVQKCLGEAAKYMSSTTKCFPTTTFSVAPLGENIDTEEGLALARWKQCDQQRKVDSGVIGSLLTELDTAIGNVLDSITASQSQLEIPTVDQDASDRYWSHGVDMLRSLQEQCRHALHEWCLHLFTLHCEVIEDADGYFAASPEFRPKSPAELLSILTVSGALIQSQRGLDFKPDVITTRPTPAQMGVVLWACSIEGRVGDYITRLQHNRCARLLELVAAAAPSLVPSDSIQLFQGRLYGGMVPIGWILMMSAMGATTPRPTAYQAIKFAAALRSSTNSEFTSLPWWGVDTGVKANLLELRNQMKPGTFEPFILAFLAVDTNSQNKPNLLRRWFAVIGSFESGVPSETGSLSKESLCRKFPKGSWDRVDLDLLQYLIGDVSGSITIEALSSTPLGELLVGQAAMSFV